MTNSADRVSKIRPFHVMALLGEAKRLEADGLDIIHMEVGEPDFPTPVPITEAGIRALSAGRTKYTPACGLPQLRESIAGYYQQFYKVQVDPRQVVVTQGGSGALGLLTALLFNPGDGVLLTDPGYPCNSNFLHLLGAVPQSVPVGEKDKFQLSVQLVKQYWQPNTRGALIASPSNPTGTLLPFDELVEIQRFISQRNGVLLVDEIYQGLTYGSALSDATADALGVTTAMALQAEDTFVINSFSKYFGMTGWRLGWLVAPDRSLPALDRMAQNFFISAPTMAQFAALEAFNPQTTRILESQRREMERRRDFLLGALPSLGFRVPVRPEGAFYVYADISLIAADSYQFCLDLLKHSGVAITPGLDFGDNHPEKYVRFAYTASIDRLKEAIDRIAKFIEVYT